MKATLVTVIVPAYNAEGTLSQTLTSVENQTHRNLEIIVVVDGATDRTEAIARAHAVTDPRISVIVTANRGVARARNTAAAAGSGDFIAPIDADDLWLPEKIEQQLAAMAAADQLLGFIYTPHDVIDSAGRLVRRGSTSLPSGRIFGGMLLVNSVGNGSSIMVPRPVFDAVGGYDASLRDAGFEGAEDWLLQLRIAREWPVGVTEMPGTLYRQHTGSMSCNRSKMARSQLKALQKVLSEGRRPAEARDALAIASFRVARTLAAKGCKRCALRHLLCAFVHSPHRTLALTIYKMIGLWMAVRR